VSGVVRSEQGGLGTVGVAGDRDPARVDQPAQGPGARRARGDQARDHESHVGRLVDDVGLVRPARCIGVLEREHGRSDDVTGSRPRPQ